MKSSTQQGRRVRPGWYAADPLAMTGTEFSTAIRRLGMSTRDVADTFGTYRYLAKAWELRIETAPSEVAAALWERIDEQDQEIERQVARLSGVAEPEFLICRGGMNGHPFGWWLYVARQVALGVGKGLVVHVE